MNGMDQRSVVVNDGEFAYLAAGDSGPLAVCLHGFPDSAHTYRHLLPRLAADGYRAVAPFMRGYAPTAVPADGRYQTGMLAMDAVEVAEFAATQAPGNIRVGIIDGCGHFLHVERPDVVNDEI